ncbi:SDR family oxidoreductase [Flavobacteriaceae bacterium]|jgi:NAD(P)-dependent dehydrogenase (short-subunit alcohol dehydrogenase family)|nr:SDR family oxidoreductase [Flavobacteriaceae bacterium]MDC3241174.1 SDR family oxidoreductase [Flavobacteriaceae bacterium]
MFELNDRVIVLTGSTGVLGGSIAKSLAKEKSIVIVLGRNEALLKSLTLELNVFSESNYFVVDVLSKEALIKVKEKIIQKWGRVDALINAVGGNLPGAVVGEDQSLFDLAEDDFDEVVDLNLKGTLLPSLVFGEVMKDQGKGSIVNYSSMAVDRTITRVAGYSASKAAMENFTRWMAVEMALRYGDGVRVNAIAPGFFIGKQNKKLLLNEDGSLTERGEKIIRNTPMKRFGKAEELSGAIHFLCSDSARFITGIVLPVDGGFSAYSGV